MAKRVVLRPEGGVSLGGGGLILLAFFLPMFRGCDRFDVTGFQAAAKAPVLYAPLLVGLLALLAGFALLRLRRHWLPIAVGRCPCSPCSSSWSVRPLRDGPGLPRREAADRLLAALSRLFALAAYPTHLLLRPRLPALRARLRPRRRRRSGCDEPLPEERA